MCTSLPDLVIEFLGVLRRYAEVAVDAHLGDGSVVPVYRRHVGRGGYFLCPAGEVESCRYNRELSVLVGAEPSKVMRVVATSMDPPMLEHLFSAVLAAYPPVAHVELRGSAPPTADGVLQTYSAVFVCTSNQTS